MTTRLSEDAALAMQFVTAMSTVDKEALDALARDFTREELIRVLSCTTSWLLGALDVNCMFGEMLGGARSSSMELLQGMALSIADGTYDIEADL